MASTSESPTPGFPSDPDRRYVAAFVQILRNERETKGLSERELTRMAEISNGVIGRAEKLERIPSVVVFRRWTRALGLDWIDICSRADQMSRS